MRYHVKFTNEGPAGWVYYLEGGEALPFDWETTGAGFYVYLPTAEEWPGFCDQQTAPNARSKRDLIVNRLAKEIKQHQVRGAKVTIDDTGIDFSFEGSWSRAILQKILGV